MLNIIDKIKQNKKKVLLSINVMFAMVSLFISALTFNFVGNSITTPELISGFIISFLAFIGSTIVGFYIYKDQIDIRFIILTLALVIIGIIGIVLGSIGYEQKS